MNTKRDINFYETCDRIFEYAKRYGLTGSQIADACDVTPQAVSKWRNHYNFPTIDNFNRLADLFGTTIDDLIVFQYREVSAYEN